METHLFPIGFSFTHEARLCYQDKPKEPDPTPEKEKKVDKKNETGGDGNAEKKDVKNEKDIDKALKDRIDEKPTAKITVPPGTKPEDLGSDGKKLGESALQDTLKKNPDASKKDAKDMEVGKNGTGKPTGNGPGLGGAKGPDSKGFNLSPEFQKKIGNVGQDLQKMLDDAANLLNRTGASPEHRVYAIVALVALVIVAINRAFNRLTRGADAKDPKEPAKKPGEDNKGGPNKNPGGPTDAPKDKESDASTKARRDRLMKEAGGPTGLEKRLNELRDKRTKENEALENQITANNTEITNLTTANATRQTEINNLEKQIRAGEGDVAALRRQVGVLQDQSKDATQTITNRQNRNKQLQAQIERNNPDLQADIKILEQLRKENQTRVTEIETILKTTETIAKTLRDNGQVEAATLITGITIDGQRIRINDAARPVLQKLLRDQGQLEALFDDDGHLLNPQIFDQVLKTMRDRISQANEKKDEKKPAK